MYRDDKVPIHTVNQSFSKKDWFDEHESGVEQLPWPPQSPDANIFEPLWGILEERARKHFPPPASFKSTLKVNK